MGSRQATTGPPWGGPGACPQHRVTGSWVRSGAETRLDPNQASPRGEGHRRASAPCTGAPGDAGGRRGTQGDAGVRLHSAQSEGRSKASRNAPAGGGSCLRSAGHAAAKGARRVMPAHCRPLPRAPRNTEVGADVRSVSRGGTWPGEIRPAAGRALARDAGGV